MTVYDNMISLRRHVTSGLGLDSLIIANGGCPVNQNLEQCESCQSEDSLPKLEGLSLIELYTLYTLFFIFEASRPFKA